MGPTNSPPKPLSDLTNVIAGGGPGNNLGLVGAALALGGIALFAMLLMGGFKYITSGGDPKAAEAAKNTITYAIIGIIIMVSSVLILTIIGQFTGVTNITNFQINRPGPL
jgi:hypothetical protein